MKRFFAVLGLVLLVLLAVLLVRASTVRSRQIAAPPVADLQVDARAAAGRLAGAIRFPTVSHEGGANVEAAAFDGLHRYLETTFPRVHATLKRETVGGYSLLYTWPGTDPSLPPLLLMSHQDVVPVEPGTEKSWTHPAFSGDMDGQFVWGRGTLDDKVGVMGILEAMELLIGKGFQPKRTILLAFGHDEEVSGPHGAAAIAALLEQRGVHPQLVVDEGGVVAEGMIPGISKPVALISTAEKGFVTVELTAEAPGGHSSMPPPHSAIGNLAAALEQLENHPFPARIDGAARRSFEFLAPEMPLGSRLPLTNLWLFGPLVERSLAGSPASNSRIRTSTAVTIVRGGVKENVLPHEAKGWVNFRILPGDTVAGVLEHVRSLVGPGVKVAIWGHSQTEPSPESDAYGPDFQLLQKTIAQTMPGALVAPNLLSGGTDTKHYQKLSHEVFRFIPVRVHEEDLARVHGTNERIGIENYGEVVRFFAQLARNAAGR
jgi:carboxypeptidase PM20D1